MGNFGIKYIITMPFYWAVSPRKAAFLLVMAVVLSRQLSACNKKAGFACSPALMGKLVA
jgi:hypothetical protein